MEPDLRRQPIGWRVSPLRSRAVLFHLRPVQLPTPGALTSLCRDLGALDRTGTVRLSGPSGHARCSRDRCPLLGERVPVEIAGARSITFAGDAILSGPWAVELSSSPLRPSRVTAAPGQSPFAYALAGIVARHARMVTCDVARSRPPVVAARR